MILWLAAWLAAAANADTVYLKNGNQLEGLIQRESGHELILDLGFGTMSLQRSDIGRVVRSTQKQRQRLLREQRSKFFDSGRWVPKSYATLFERYQELTRTREAAMDAKTRRDALMQEQSGLASELPGLEGQSRYDTLLRLHEIRTLLPLADRDTQSYMTKHRSFEEALARTPAPTTPEEHEFRRHLGRAMEPFSADFEKDEVVSRREGDHLIVQATLEGRVPATFLVDTGATVTTVSSRIAEQLTPIPGTENEGLSTVADGRTMKVRTFEISSIELGRSRQERVRVAVMPSPGPNVDGLLGMSYLQFFSVQVDTAGGKLLLNRLK